MTKAEMQKKIKRLYKDGSEVKCRFCGEVISEDDDPESYEYVKTKRKSEFFVHTKCVKGSD